MSIFYRSLDDADAYFNDQLFIADWTGATDANKIKALKQAARSLDSLRWRGYKVPVYNLFQTTNNATQAQIEAAEDDQAKSWPRDSDFMSSTPASTVHTLAAWATSPSAGNFTLTIKLIQADGTETEYTTGVIGFNATASAVESVIDTALSGVSGWTNGDIAVSGGPLTTDPMVLTFSGSSVSGSLNERTTIMPDATFLTDGVLADPASTVTISGECPDRVFFAQCEEAVSLLSGRDPKQEFENSVVSSDGVSSTRISSDRGQMPPIHTQHMFTSALAWKYLAKYLDNKEADSFKFERK